MPAKTAQAGLIHERLHLCSRFFVRVMFAAYAVVAFARRFRASNKMLMARHRRRQVVLYAKQVDGRPAQCRKRHFVRRSYRCGTEHAVLANEVRAG